MVDVHKCQLDYATVCILKTLSTFVH